MGKTKTKAKNNVFLSSRIVTEMQDPDPSAPMGPELDTRREYLGEPGVYPLESGQETGGVAHNGRAKGDLQKREQLLDHLLSKGYDFFLPQKVILIQVILKGC